MPYASLEELPATVRDNLPKHGQEIYQAAFNSAWEGTCTGRDDQEVCATRIAWSAVKNAYHKDDAGTWIQNKCVGPRCFFGNAVKITTHDAVLFTLNRWLLYGKGRIFNAVENFEGTESAWDKVPLIYAQEHPDPDLIEEDLKKALESVQTGEGKTGQLCGSISNTEVVIPGQPRLESKITFSDPVVEKRYKAGELSLSIAYRCTESKQEKGHLTGKVKPNHILIFVQDDANQPRDPGAMLLNKGEVAEVDNVTKFENTGRVISTANKSRFKQALDSLWGLFAEMAGDGDENLQNAGPAVPPNPSGFGIGNDAPGCKIAEKDFPAGTPLSEIRQRFAYDDGSGNYSGLSLPHHYVNGDVAPNCVRAAMQAIGGARSGQPMDLGGKETAVKAHLQAHLDAIATATGTVAKNQDDKMTEELEVKLKAAEEAIKAKELELANKTAEFDALKKESEARNAALKTFEQKQNDTEWETLKNKRIPVGWLKGEGKEVELRKEYETDKPAFLNKLLDHPKGESTPEEGEQYAANKGGNDTLAIVRELRTDTGRMR